LGPVVNDAKERLRDWQGWRVQHVSRSANDAAHQLAKLALGYAEAQEWREAFPISLLDIVIADQRSSV
jgi:hypothetical protein